MRALDIFDLFKCTRSADLKRVLGKNAVLRADDFIKTVNAATLRKMGDIRCRSLCRLLPTDWNISQIVKEAVRGEAKSRKVSKLSAQLLRANRHHLHMFYRDGGPEWWAFQFSLHDLGTAGLDQHWDRPHIHLTTWLSHPRNTKEWLIEIMEGSDTPSFSHDYHVPFEGDIGQEMRFGR